MHADVRKTRLDAAVIITTGAAAGLGMTFFAAASAKWLVFSTLLLTGAAAFMILPARQRYLAFLFAFFFTLPMGIDFNPIYLAPLSYRPINGFRIFLYDLPLFFLYISWVGQLTLNPEKKIRFFPWITIPFLLLWILAVAGLFNSLAPTAIKLGGAFEVLKSWLIFFYLANNLDDYRAILLCAGAIAANLFFEAPIGLYQWIFGSFPGLGGAHSIVEMVVGASFAVSRVGGTVGSPNNLAAHIGMIIPLILALMFATMPKRYKSSLVALLAIAVLLLLLTYSRGGWMGALAGGAVAVYLSLAKATKRKIGSFILLTGLLVVLAVSAVAFVPSIRARLFEHDYGAAMSRVPMSKLALNIIRQEPWLGVGLGNYTYVSKNYDTTSEAISYTFNWPVHNEFLLIASEMGLPALALFLFILAVTGVNLYRIGISRADPILPFMAFGFIGGFIAWGVHHQFELMHSIITAKFWANIGLIQAMQIYTAGLSTENAEA